LDGLTLGELTSDGLTLRGQTSRELTLLGLTLKGLTLKGLILKRLTLRGLILKRLLDQLSKVKTLHNAKLDEELLISLREKYPALFEVPPEM
jgi:hypothetical protein